MRRDESVGVNSASVLSLAGKVELAPQAAAELLVGYPRTTLTLYDHGPSSGLDAIGPADVGRLIAIEPLSQAAALTLLAAAPDAPWHLLPADARLEDADPEQQLYWDASKLFEFFTALPNVGYAIASKLLHLKRPSFIPILDSFLRNVYDAAAEDAYRDCLRASDELPKGRRLYWAAIGQDLLSRENRDAIAALRRILHNDERPLARQISTLSSVRLIDMVVWRWKDHATRSN